MRCCRSFFAGGSARASDGIPNGVFSSADSPPQKKTNESAGGATGSSVPGKKVRKPSNGVDNRDVTIDNDIDKIADAGGGESNVRTSANGTRQGKITNADVQAVAEEIASQVQRWDSGGFTTVKKLQDAIRNHGDVSLIRKTDDETPMAVKRMPNKWVTSGPNEFKNKYPTTAEQPWKDIALVKLFERHDVPYICKLYNVYKDDEQTYVVTNFASEGDLFSWCDREPRPGAAREAFLLPIICQIFAAVRWIHELGVSHRDISLENILLTPAANSDQLQVKLIDFGMATLARKCRREVRGKQSYQAPEMHIDQTYDAFLTDAFAVGVVVFAMSVEDYPWIATQKQLCQLFDYVSSRGFIKFCAKRKLRKGNGEMLIDVFSKPLLELLEGLLAVTPTTRFSLGETCFVDEVQKGTRTALAVWDCKFLASWRTLLPFGGGPS